MCSVLIHHTIRHFQLFRPFHIYHSIVRICHSLLAPIKKNIPHRRVSLSHIIGYICRCVYQWHRADPSANSCFSHCHQKTIVQLCSCEFLAHFQTVKRTSVIVRQPPCRPTSCFPTKQFQLCGSVAELLLLLLPLLETELETDQRTNKPSTQQSTPTSTSIFRCDRSSTGERALSSLTPSSHHHPHRHLCWPVPKLGGSIVKPQSSEGRFGVRVPVVRRVCASAASAPKCTRADTSASCRT